MRHPLRPFLGPTAGSRLLRSALALGAACAVVLASSCPGPAAFASTRSATFGEGSGQLGLQTLPVPLTASDAATPTPSAGRGPGYGRTLSDDATDSTPSFYYVGDCGDDPTSAPYDIRVLRDSHGIVMNSYSWTHGAVYSPVAVADYAIHCYVYWLHTGDTRAQTDFLRHARWLRDNMDARGGIPFRWDYPGRGLHAPWLSCMSQGLAMSALTRAYVMTKDRSFLTAAIRALGPMAIDTSAGGTACTRKGQLWFEEYPDATPSHVLNGGIFGDFGVYDLLRTTGNLKAAALFRSANRTLADRLPSYESRGAILYQLTGWGCYSFDPYFALEIAQLRSLGLITGDTRFSATADRWETSFRPYPLPRVTLSGGSVPGPLNMTRLAVTGVVSPVFRSTRLVVTARVAGAADTTLATLAIRAVHGRETVPFSYTSPPVERETTLDFTVSGEPGSRASISAWSDPGRLIRAAAGP